MRSNILDLIILCYLSILTAKCFVPGPTLKANHQINSGDMIVRSAYGIEIIPFEAQRHSLSVRDLVARIDTADEGPVDDCSGISSGNYSAEKGGAFLVAVYQLRNVEESIVIGCGGLIVGVPEETEGDTSLTGVLRRVCVNKQALSEFGRQDDAEDILMAIIEQLSAKATKENAVRLLTLGFSDENGREIQQPSVELLQDLGFLSAASSLRDVDIFSPAVPHMKILTPKQVRGRSSNQERTLPRSRRDRDGREVWEYTADSPPRLNVSDEVSPVFEIPRSGDLLIVVPAAVIAVLGILTTLLIASETQFSSLEIVDVLEI